MTGFDTRLKSTNQQGLESEASVWGRLMLIGHLRPRNKMSGLPTNQDF
jgi:hypothetical protein